jgi:hypothetical protein
MGFWFILPLFSIKIFGGWRSYIYIHKNRFSDCLRIAIIRFKNRSDTRNGLGVHKNRCSEFLSKSYIRLKNRLITGGGMVLWYQHKVGVLYDHIMLIVLLCQGGEVCGCWHLWWMVWLGLYMLPTISRKQDNSRAHIWWSLLNYLSPGNENFCCVHVCVSVCVCVVCVSLCVRECHQSSEQSQS